MVLSGGELQKIAVAPTFCKKFEIIIAVTFVIEGVYYQSIQLKGSLVARKDGLTPPEEPGVLALKNVSFAYDQSKGNVLNNISLTIKPQEKVAVVSALVRSGFRARPAALERGIDTLLTREFEEEGVNLSGGEAQKLAIARVFYKPCRYIILDEPSSALDPISEYNLNKTMFEAAKIKQSSSSRTASPPRGWLTGSICWRTAALSKRAPMIS